MCTATKREIEATTEQRIRAYEAEIARLRSLVFEDELTGLGNRRQFDQELERGVAGINRYGGELSLLLCDVDRFKFINDAYGHPTGDAVLQAVASLLRPIMREVDVVCRLGGDEFAVLMPNTGRMEAARVERRIDAQMNMVLGLPEAVPASVSIGVATAEGSNADPDDLYQRADAAMYQAKRSKSACARRTMQCASERNKQGGRTNDATNEQFRTETLRRPDKTLALGSVVEGLRR